jgi:predicted N-acetyltransferase YhbS
MLVHERARKRGVGQALLRAFAASVSASGIYCVPHAHLESFYATIGFLRAESGPRFLEERVAKYRSNGYDTILMRRD